MLFPSLHSCNEIGKRESFEFARAAITKYHRLSGLTNKNLFPRSLEGSKSRVKALAGLPSSEVFVFDSEMVVFSQYLHMIFPLHTSVFKFPLLIRKDISHIRLVLTAMTLFYMIYFCEDPVSRVEANHTSM